MLSVCLIARNEEASLPRALRSVQAVADEIVLVDTGSADRTTEVARQHGAKVFHFPWCDDFSAARNHAIDHASGDWILWLDADEELLSESVEDLRKCIARSDALAYQVKRQDLQCADRLDSFTTMWQLRLFRRRDELRFVGRCHPHFRSDIWQVAEESGLKFEASEVKLRHHGYVGELRPAKLRRAAKLLELELQDRPGQLYYQVELGRTLLNLGDGRGHKVLREASGQLRSVLNAAEAPDPVFALLLEYLLLVPDSQLPDHLTRQSVVELVQRWFPKSPYLLWPIARLKVERGDFADAELILRHLIRMGQEQSYDMSVSFDPGFVGDSAKANLGVCLVRQMKFQEARTIFQELSHTAEHGGMALESIRVIDQALGAAREPLGGISYHFS